MIKLLKQIRREIFKFLPDIFYLHYLYYRRFGKKLNLKNPQTFNEKLNWLKLYDRNRLYTTLVDKYAVKKYVADKIGEQYVIPNLGIWNSFEEIDFDKLPDQFVLKTTHDSGGVVICKDKNIFDKHAAKEKLKKSLESNFYYMYREWPYKNVPRKIIAEQYMEDNQTKELRDYKFFCFSGIPKMLLVISDRYKPNEKMKFDFYDMKYKLLPFTTGYPNNNKNLNKPKSFEKMKSLAEYLSKDIPYVRMDFYEINEQVYFGEYTFFPVGGFIDFSPEEWDRKIGDWLILPKK